MPQYLVGSKNKRTEQVSFAAHPRVHASHDSASKEAQRLAALHTDKKFFVVQVKEVFQSVEVEKTTL